MLYAYWNLDFIKVGLGSADISGCMMRKVTYMPSIDVRLAVVQRPVNDGKVFKKKRNNLGFSMIMKKLGTLSSLFMKYSVHKGRFTPDSPLI